MSLAEKPDPPERNTWGDYLKTRLVSIGDEHRYESNFLQAYPQVSGLIVTSDQVRTALRPEGCEDPSWPLFEAKCTEDEMLFLDGTCDSERPVWVDRLSAFSHEAEMISKRSKELPALNGIREEDDQSWDKDAKAWTLSSLRILHDYGEFMFREFASLENICREDMYKYADGYLGYSQWIKQMDKIILRGGVDLATVPDSELCITADPTDMAEGEHADHSGEGSKSLVNTAGGSERSSGNSKGGSKRSKGKGKGKGKGKEKSQALNTAEDTQEYLTREALAKIKMLRATAEVIKTNFKVTSARASTDVKKTRRHMYKALSTNVAHLRDLAKRRQPDVENDLTASSFAPPELPLTIEAELERKLKVFSSRDTEARKGLASACRELAGMTREPEASTSDSTRQLTLRDIILSVRGILDDPQSVYRHEAVDIDALVQELTIKETKASSAQRASSKKSKGLRRRQLSRKERTGAELLDTHNDQVPTRRDEDEGLSAAEPGLVSHKLLPSRSCSPAETDGTVTALKAKASTLANLYISAGFEEFERSLQQRHIRQTPSRDSLTSDCTGEQRGLADWAHDCDLDSNMNPIRRRKSFPHL